MIILVQWAMIVVLLVAVLVLYAEMRRRDDMLRHLNRAYMRDRKVGEAAKRWTGLVLWAGRSGGLSPADRELVDAVERAYGPQKAQG